ncbi:hypothetical protein GCM10027592_53170 [Spirosoma flavus]
MVVLPHLTEHWVQHNLTYGQIFGEQFQPILLKLFPYVVSFLILSIYWTGHQYRFYFIKLITRKHLWINGIFIALGHLIYIQE